MHLKASVGVFVKRTLHIAVLLFATSSFSQTQPVMATIDGSKTGAPISKYLYGQFLEHAGSLVNEGVWAEMLDDRKFFNTITSKLPEAPAEPVRRRRSPPRRWVPIGADEFVTMDKANPYTGDHSPLIKLDPKEPHGFQQTGLSVLKSKAYTGRIVLTGTPGAKVTVSLVWGDAPGDRQTVVIPKLSAGYAKYPLRFTAQGDSENVRLEIVGTGTGSVRVGAVSLMPANNVEGFRAEVVTALKQLKSGVYRFPGGNFVSAHEWRNAVGDIDKRPPIYDPVWRAVQPNDVGTDEFLTLCRLLDVEPYITVNAGFGDAWAGGRVGRIHEWRCDYADGKMACLGQWPSPALQGEVLALQRTVGRLSDGSYVA